MKTSEKHLGTGLTRLHQETKKPETREELVQLLHEISYSGTHPFEEHLDYLTSHAETKLREKGLPTN